MHERIYIYSSHTFRNLLINLYAVTPDIGTVTIRIARTPISIIIPITLIVTQRKPCGRIHPIHIALEIIGRQTVITDIAIKFRIIETQVNNAVSYRPSKVMLDNFHPTPPAVIVIRFVTIALGVTSIVLRNKFQVGPMAG